MKAELIKKAIEVCNPEGFSYDGIRLLYKHHYVWGPGKEKFSDVAVNEELAWKAFVQACIEGVNRQSQDGTGDKWFFVTVESDVIEVHQRDKDNQRFWIENYPTIDAAKEAALEYVMEVMV